MVHQREFTAAACLLDNSGEVVRRSYSHIEGQMTEDAGKAFSEQDSCHRTRSKRAQP